MKIYMIRDNCVYLDYIIMLSMSQPVFNTFNNTLYSQYFEKNSFVNLKYFTFIELEQVLSDRENTH